ncbi:MAG: efflux RND transporter periplasmic adaptor subunit [Bacteroidota bacterium]
MDRKIEKKRWNWLSILIGIIVIGGLAFLGTSIYKGAGTSRLNVKTERLLLDTIHHGVFQEFIPISGVIQPIKTVFIDAVEGGKIEERLIEDGSTVQKGQPILRLSNPDLQLSYLNQEAQIVSQINQIRNLSVMMEQQSLNLKEQALDVEFQIDLLSKRVRRNTDLYKDKVIAQVEYEDTQDEYEHLLRRRKLLSATVKKDSISQQLQREQMDASLDLMQRNLKIAKLNLENLTVRAPIGGQLSGLNKELGELISSGENIAQIDDLSNYKVYADIDEYYVARISPGQRGTFTLAGKAYDLEIKKIYPEVSNGTFKVDMVFTAAIPPSIKRGQTLSIKLALSNQVEAKLLAKGSFYQSTGGNWVYVVDAGTGKAYRQEIKLGRQNPSFYEVVQGLNEGDVVITSSYGDYEDKDELVLQ